MKTKLLVIMHDDYFKLFIQKTNIRTIIIKDSAKDGNCTTHRHILPVF